MDKRQEWARDRSLDADNVGAMGAWIADDTYEIKLCFVATPALTTMTAKFSGNSLSL